MKLSKIRIVLVETSHPGNIGSSARAMKTMGIDKLYLVNPNLSPYKSALEMAAGSDALIENAVITTSLEEALQGCKLVCALSARPRDISLPGLSPKEFANLLKNTHDDTNVGIIFGRERSGLTNDELLHANYHVQIPCNPEYSSLNVSQAVQIICYELRMQLLNPDIQVKTKENTLAPYEDLQNFYAHLEQTLEIIDFLKPENHNRIIQKLKRLFNRSNLERVEINILRGILTQMQEYFKRTIISQNMRR